MAFAFGPHAGPWPSLIWADMGIRLGALLVDAGLMLAALVAAALIAEVFGIDRSGDVAVYSAGANATMVTWVALLLAYHPVCWWAFQGTVGQRVLGLRVLRDRDGAPLGVVAATIRYVVWVVCQVTVILAVVAAVEASSDRARRAWWDRAAGSLVVRSV